MNSIFRISFFLLILSFKALSQDSAFVYYDTDKYYVKPQFKNELNKKIDDLGDLKDYYFVLTAHTDSVAGVRYNQVLSENRAKSVVEILLKKGVDRDSISISPNGELNPNYNNSSVNGRAKNRAVRITWKNTGEIEVFKIQIFPIGSDTTVIRTNNDCVLKVPPSSFIKSSGGSVPNGQINVYIKEYPRPSDMIVGEIPMYSRKERIMYDSYGMFSIKAFLNDTYQLALRPNSEILVNCPLPEDVDGIDFYKFNEFKDEWKSLDGVENIALYEPENRELDHYIDTFVKGEDKEAPIDTILKSNSNPTEADSVKNTKSKKKRKLKWFRLRFLFGVPLPSIGLSKYKKTVKDAKSGKGKR